MTYNLFLDDERKVTDIYTEDSEPAADSFIIARSFDEAVHIIAARGMPKFISFDNDLGNNMPEGYDLAKLLVELDMDGIHEFASDFSFHVHSANCKAWENISSYLLNYIKIKEERKYAE